MCFCVCLRVCDLVFTGQFNLLKIYVHPALPPALPQALNLSTAVRSCVFLCSSLCPSSPALDMVKLLLNYFCSLGTYFRSVEFSSVALTWLKCEGCREKRERWREAETETVLLKVEGSEISFTLLCYVEPRRVEPIWAEPCSFSTVSHQTQCSAFGHNSVNQIKILCVCYMWEWVFST